MTTMTGPDTRMFQGTRLLLALAAILLVFAVALDEPALLFVALILVILDLGGR